MAALFRGREVNIWRILSISCVVMLIINPYFLAYDVGFLMSYSAIIGLIYMGTKGEKDEKVQGEVINPPVLRTTPPLQKDDK